MARYSTRLLVAAGLAVPGLVGAQATAQPAAAPTERAELGGLRQFVISPRGGAIQFDRAAGIETGMNLGLDLQYQLTRMFSLGTNLTFGRANTRGEDFLMRLTYGAITTGDSSYFFKVQQPVTLVDAQFAAVARLPLADSRVLPFATVGGGWYTLYLDPEQNRGRSRYTRPSITYGAGVGYRLSPTTGVQLDVRGLTFTQFDRDRLRPSDPTRVAFQIRQFAEDFPTPPAKKSTVTNYMINLGFNFTPSFGGTSRPAPPVQVQDTTRGMQ